MILCDANVLLYAVNEDAALHERARRWLETALSGTEPVAFSWVALLAFIRLSTRPALWAAPLTVAETLEIVTDWLEQPNAVVVEPTNRHPRVLRQLLEPLGTGGNLSSDAHLAALALEHGARLCSFDRDFARFPGVRWFEPA